MDDAIRAYILYLQLERGVSQETHRNYQSDLQQFLAHIQKQFFRTDTDPHPDCHRCTAYPILFETLE